MDWIKRPGVLVAAGCFVVILLWAFLHDWKPSLHELQRVQDALAHAHSWHFRAVVKAYGQISVIDQDVACPDFHATIRNGTEADSAVTYEVVRVGAFAYERNLSSSPNWTEKNVNYLHSICHNGPVIGEKPLAVTIMELQTEAVLLKLDRADSNGVPCRNWEIRSLDRNQFGGKPQGTICISEATHLPLEFRLMDGNMIYQFSQWNDSIQIELPAEVSNRSEGGGGQFPSPGSSQ